MGLVSTAINLGVAQFGRALDLGSRGREFESRYSDHANTHKQPKRRLVIDGIMRQVRNWLIVLPEEIDFPGSSEPMDRDYRNEIIKWVERHHAENMPPENVAKLMVLEAIENTHFSDEQYKEQLKQIVENNTMSLEEEVDYGVSRKQGEKSETQKDI